MKKTVSVPQWAKRVVWYQIFPERFYNGDTSNDPTLESIKGAYPHDLLSKWQIHPWHSDWYKLQDYEKENKKDIWFNIERRRYGGDIQGIIDKLNYLKELGIGAIYLNPVFMSPSSHKYDGATYHHIDPHFGPDPAKDYKIITEENPADSNTWQWTGADKLFLSLVQKVHRLGMKIIIDGVFNHMGLNSWIFKDIVKNQRSSEYRDWFKIKNWEERFEYDSWLGFNELPEINQDKNGIVKGPKQYIFDITKRWMDPDGDGDPRDGIDGWRLDVASWVKHRFWKDWRRYVKSINPDAYLTAEIIEPVKETKPYLFGDEFDAVMNYNFAFACYDYFIKKDKLTVSEFVKRLKELWNAFPEEINEVMMNLLDSHDTPRLGSIIVNKDLLKINKWMEFHRKSKAVNPDYDTRKPNEDEITIHKLTALFQMTYAGAPMIYYGDEAGMWGANDPCCRKPMVWEDLEYEEEIFQPDQSLYKQQKVIFNRGLFEHYKKLIHIRNNNIELQLGSFKIYYMNDYDDIFFFEREYEGNKIIVGINNSETEQSIIIDLPGDIKYDLLNEIPVERKSGDKTGIILQPKWGVILK